MVMIEDRPGAEAALTTRITSSFDVSWRALSSGVSKANFCSKK